MVVQTNNKRGKNKPSTSARPSGPSMQVKSCCKSHIDSIRDRINLLESKLLNKAQLGMSFFNGIRLSSCSSSSTRTRNRIKRASSKGTEMQDEEDPRKNCSLGVAQNRVPALQAADCNQQISHILLIHSRDVDKNNFEPSFLMGGNTCSMMWDRLGESLIKANAVSSSVTGRLKTQGAGNQTTRITCSPVGQAAAAQVTSTLLVLSLSRTRMENDPDMPHMCNMMAHNSINPCKLLGHLMRNEVTLEEEKGTAYFAIASGMQMVYNSCPVRVSRHTTIDTCKKIARMEMEQMLVSDHMGTHNIMLKDICRSLAYDGMMDNVWCSWVIIVYLCSHPRGRDILRRFNLTDVEIQAALFFERYGSEEIGRRFRQRNCKAKKRKRDDEMCTHSGSNRNNTTTSSSKGYVSNDEEDDTYEISSDIVSPKTTRAGSCSSSSSSTITTDATLTTTKTTTAHKSFYLGSMSDSHSILEFWHQAFQSCDFSVLLTLGSTSRAAVETAALNTLRMQTKNGNVSEMDLLREICRRTAMKSAEMMVKFLGGKHSQNTSVHMIAQSDGTRAIGFKRTPNEASLTALHACRIPPRIARAPVHSGILVMWSDAYCEMRSVTNDIDGIPRVLESYKNIQANGVGKKAKAVYDRIIEGNSSIVVPTYTSGNCRSFLTLRMPMQLTESIDACSKQVYEDIKRWVHHKGSFSSNTATPLDLPVNLGVKQDIHAQEPVCTSLSNMACGLFCNETIRRWMGSKTRKNNHCIQPIGYVPAHEMARNCPEILSSEPSPMLTITDIHMEVDAVHRRQADCNVCFQVCGHNATRIREAIVVMARCVGMDTYTRFRRTRALILNAASQASFVGALSHSLSTCYANNTIASGKKISVADSNTISFLSPWDCYIAGISNVKPVFENTPYRGVYGCRLDTGYTMPGLLAHNLKSDKRQHGNCHLSEDTADEMTDAFTKKHWIAYKWDEIKHQNVKMPLETALADTESVIQQNRKDTNIKFAEVPLAARGIPHSFIPGVHTLLDDYCDAIETFRSEIGSESDTSDNVMCLPFSPFTQCLPPDIEASSDSTLRGCFKDPSKSSVVTGRAHILTSTAEHRAIAKEPLFRRPCQVSKGDCPFATCYENLDSLFNALGTLAMMAVACYSSSGDGGDGKHMARHLFDVINEYVYDGKQSSSKRRVPTQGAMLWAPDAIMLMATMYPEETRVGRYAFSKGVAKLLSASMMRKNRSYDPSGKRCSLASERMLSAKEREDVVRFWKKMSDKAEDGHSVWSYVIEKMLQMIIDNDGSHNVSDEAMDKFRKGIDRCGRAVWHAHRIDGNGREDIRQMPSPKSVHRHHLDPVFCGNEEQKIEQRGSPLSIKPHSYRQILSSMLGTATIDKVLCNVAINEGGMALRVSSDATIQENGKDRTRKGCSPVQSDGDEAAYGTIHNKKKGAVLQKNAWNMNAKLQLPLYTSVSPPRPKHILKRGTFGSGKVEINRAVESLRTHKSMLPQSFQDSLQHMLDASTFNLNFSKSA